MTRVSSNPSPEFLIGELARRSGRTVHTLRWYEASGLLPGVRRDAGNRRTDDARHVGWLDLIDRLRFSGMSTAEMRRYASLVMQGRKSLPARRELLIVHRGRVRENLAEWRHALTLLDRKVEFYERWLATGVRPPEPVLPKRASKPGPIPSKKASKP